MSKQTYECSGCGTTAKPRINGSTCPACASYLDANESIRAAKYLENMKYRDPDGKVGLLMKHATTVLRQSALNSRHVAKLLGAVKRP